MPTATLERQETERLLHAQLERMRRGGAAAGRLGRLLARLRRHKPAGASGAEPPAKWSPARWIGALRRRREPDRLAELQDGIAAQHRERTLDALYAAAAAPPPETEGNLPNVSRSGGNLGGMKQTPARDWGPPPKVQFPKPEKSKDRRSDLIVAALGVALGLTCALFPWYIFFNQEQFGVQAIAFGGRGSNAGRIVVDPKAGDGAQAALQQAPRNLDLFSTGTLSVKPETAQQAPGVDQQPFPAEAAEFKLVHVANGRAMIEDDAGLWIVQQGSLLPDSTRVKAIEKRGGQWVLVTSAERVVELEK